MVCLNALFVALALGQSAAPPASAEISKLAWMVGDWEGTGWQASPGGRTAIKCREFVAIKGAGGILTISDHQARKRQGADEFGPEGEAFFTITFSDQLVLQAYGSAGKLFEAVVTSTKNRIEWEIPGSGMKMRLFVTDEGVWVEEGHRVVDGKSERVFEIILKRKK